jgi:hypothetical protein
MDFDDFISSMENEFTVKDETKSTINFVKSIHSKSHNISKYSNTCCGMMMLVDRDDYVCSNCGKVTEYNGGTKTIDAKDMKVDKMKVNDSYSEIQYQSILEFLKERNEASVRLKFSNTILVNAATKYNAIQRNVSISTADGEKKKFVIRRENKNQVLAQLLLECAVESGFSAHPEDITAMLNCTGYSRAQKYLVSCREVIGESKVTPENERLGLIKRYCALIGIDDAVEFIDKLITLSISTETASSIQPANKVVAGIYIYARSVRNTTITGEYLEKAIPYTKIATLTKFCTAVKQNYPKFAKLFAEYGLKFRQ